MSNNKENAENIQKANQSNEIVNLNDLLPSLECPVCLEFFQKPILMCNNGHNICCACDKKLTSRTCPVCKCPMSRTRNFSLEHIIEKIGARCQFTAFGCSFTGNKKALKAHQGSCSFRQYLCPWRKIYNRCAWQGSYDELVPHFSSNHPTMPVANMGVTVNFPEYDTKKDYVGVALVTVDPNLLFVLHFKSCLKEELTYWTVQKVERIFSVPDFKYTIVIDGPDKKISMSFACTSSIQSFANIFKSGNCAIIPLSVVRNFLNDEQDLSFQIFIHKKKAMVNLNQVKGNVPKKSPTPQRKFPKFGCFNWIK